MAIGIQSDGSMLEANVTVKNGRKKAYENKAHVVEAFKEDYIKVDLVDEDDHYFKLNWEGEQYVGNFFGTTLTCQYDVTQNFKADISVSGDVAESGPVIYATRSNGGRPDRYKE